MSWCLREVEYRGSQPLAARFQVRKTVKSGYHSIGGSMYFQPQYSCTSRIKSTAMICKLWKRGDAFERQTGVVTGHESELDVASFRKYNNLIINLFA